MQLDTDTIAAVATAPGRGGIGIVRLSGARAQAIAAPLYRLRQPLAPGRARFAELLDAAGNLLDQAVVTFFAAPRSYTGEDIVEIAAHGAPVLLDHLLRACLAGGARLAAPGEFTQRAFLNGRLDLTQAEAVADLVNAHTLDQARLAAAQLGGALSRAIAPLKQTLVELIAALEAGVDFAEDDLDLMPQQQIETRTEALRTSLAALAATYRHGRILREGFRLAIVGRPNAGKSSLFNRLLKRERAIVTPLPGTTRDPISDHLAIAGIPVELIDTAGLRDTPEAPSAAAEAEGIRRSRAMLAEAELVLHVIDASELQAGSTTRLDTEDSALLQGLAGRPHLIALNKSDLAPTVTLTGSGATAIPVSALTGEGISTLTTAIVQALTGGALSTASTMITNLRQYQSVSEALAASARANEAAQSRLPHEFLLLDLYACLAALDTLTGATTPDDILNLIFSTFCIGK